jgi:hypothetical protein
MSGKPRIEPLHTIISCREREGDASINTNMFTLPAVDFKRQIYSGKTLTPPLISNKLK